MPAKILCASPGMKPLLLGMAAGAQVNNFLKDGLPNFRHQNDMVVTKRLQGCACCNSRLNFLSLAYVYY